MFDLAVIGGGIVGLATAFRYLRRFSGRSAVVLEKEERLAAHQSGRNSGVLHSGLYYPPGSLKAALCRTGKAGMEALCEELGVPWRRCGKLIVATEHDQLGRLAALAERARTNGVEVREVGPTGIRELEPHVRGLAGLHVPSTGVVDFRQVAEALGAEIRRLGGELRTGARVTGLEPRGDRLDLRLAGGEELAAARAITCGGLQADRLAGLSGGPAEVRIVPFLGEYFGLRPEFRTRVRALVYPVADPRFPFLGVHLTRRIDGRVDCGPSAVPTWSREGYSKTAFEARDAWSSLTWPGFWRLAGRHLPVAAGELRRSLSRAAFARSAARLLPELEADWLEPAPCGVRAQALDRSGRLVDDFLIEQRGPLLHVLNAPSPAATSSLAIAEHLLGHIESAAP